MKKNRASISTIVMVVLASLSCAQSSDKTVANRSAVFAPELRWKYESGG